VLSVSNLRIRQEQTCTQQALDERSTALEAVVEEQQKTQAALKRETRTAYFQALALAQGELQFSQVGRAQVLLEQCPVELRDWGWHFLQRAAQGNERTLRGHADKYGGVSAVAFHPDGKRLASSAWDGTVRIWDVAGNKEWKVLNNTDNPGSGFDTIKYSPDGRWLAATSVDCTVHVWEANTAAEVKVLKGHADRVWGLDFSPAGRRLSTGSDDGSVKVWDLVSREPILTIAGHSGPVKAVAFNKDGSRLAT